MSSVLKVTEIQDPTNSNTALEIDSSGNVQCSNLFPTGLTYWPSFRARKTSGGDQTGYLTFATVVFDKGSDFTSGASAKFTAPIDGVYYFTYSAVMTNTSSGNTIELRKNGSATDIVVYSGNDPYAGLTLAGALELDKDDYVQIYANTAVQQNYGAWSGFLITAS